MTPKQHKNLTRLLSPRHVAFIGGRYAAIAAEQCAAIGFDGPIWGVNPRRETLGGQPCFAQISDLPEPPDAVFLAIPRPTAIDTVYELRELGAGGVVCFTAGFGELGQDGAENERALLEAAGDLALVGPNCYGLINYVQGVALWPFPHGSSRVDRGIAIVSQSGMLGNTLTMNQRSVPLAYVISAGNQAMLGVEDYLEVFVEDPTIDAIGLYLEGLHDIQRFTNAAIRALEADIPIVALKAGRSEIGARLAISHTGSLSGTDQAYQALFDRLGIVRVDSQIMLLETLKMLVVAGGPKGHRVAAFTASGGEAIMLADNCVDAGLSFPEPSSHVAEALADQLPPIATVSNPLDYTTPLWGDEENLPAVFRTMFNDAYDAALLVQDYPTPSLGANIDEYVADARSFIAATQSCGIPAAICSGLPENLPEDIRRMLVAGGVAPLQGINEALAAIAGAAIYGKLRARIEAYGDTEKLRIAPVIANVSNFEVLNEWEGKRRLAAVGVPIPEGRLVNPLQAPEAAKELGFPVVVKLVSAQLPHKTEAGAVRVNLKSKTEVAEAVTAITKSVARRASGVVCNDFLVERMVADPIAELLVGIRRDPQFGQVMVLASGGILVELVRDSQTLLLPTDRQSVSEALAALKVSQLLDGYRGQLPGDRDSLIEVILTLAHFAESHCDELGELDINPLMVLHNGVFAIDVLMRVSTMTP